MIHGVIVMPIFFTPAWAFGGFDMKYLILVLVVVGALIGSDYYYDFTGLWAGDVVEATDETAVETAAADVVAALPAAAATGALTAVNGKDLLTTAEKAVDNAVAARKEAAVSLSLSFLEGDESSGDVLALAAAYEAEGVAYATLAVVQDKMDGEDGEDSLTVSNLRKSAGGGLRAAIKTDADKFWVEFRSAVERMSGFTPEVTARS